MTKTNPLAVIERAESICAIYEYDGTANELISARAAVAELVEAARRLEKQPALDDAMFMVNRPGVTLALINLRAALAAFEVTL